MNIFIILLLKYFVYQEIICIIHNEDFEIFEKGEVNIVTTEETIRNKIVHEQEKMSQYKECINEIKADNSDDLLILYEKEVEMLDLTIKNSFEEETSNIACTNQLIENKNTSIFKTNDNIDVELDSLLDDFIDLISEKCPENNDDFGTYVLVENSYVYINFNQFKPNLELIRESLVKLNQAAICLYKNISDKLRKFYKKKFENTVGLVCDYINTYSESHLTEIINFASLDEQIKTQIFDVKNVEGVYKPSLDKEKIESFFLLPILKVFSSIKFPKKKLAFEILIIQEFYNIRMYYKEFPELLVLESLRGMSSNYFVAIFIYLRTLNVLLRQYSNDKSSFSEFRDIVIFFIEKIITSEHGQTKCNIEAAKEKSVFCFPCGNTHQNYFYILIYNIDFMTRNNFLSNKNSEMELLKTQDNVKLACVYMVFKHLIFNCYLFFAKHEPERINNFINLVLKNFSCINCVIEECISILSK